MGLQKYNWRTFDCRSGPDDMNVVPVRRDEGSCRAVYAVTTRCQFVRVSNQQQTHAEAQGGDSCTS
jgi:hypothetical protein